MKYPQRLQRRFQGWGGMAADNIQFLLVPAPAVSVFLRPRLKTLPLAVVHRT
jgi:hypothetical protein